MADVRGVISSDIDAKIGLNFLDAFFKALGATDLAGKLSAVYKDKGASTLKFQITDATRDSLDPIRLASRLMLAKPIEGHPFAKHGNRFFVSTAVARSRSITIRAERSRASGLKVDIGPKDLLGYTGKVTATRAEEGALTFQGPTPLAFGIRLVELLCDEDGGSLQMKTSGEVALRRSGKPTELTTTPAFLMSPNEDAFITVR